MPDSLFEFTAKGKLLLTGEYFVLDGVTALAVPTRKGQSFQVFPAEEKMEHDLYWRAFDLAGERWFSGAFDRADWGRSIVANQTPGQLEGTAERIGQLLYAAEQLRPGCTDSIRGLTVTTRLQFDRRWGLGSSSTLVAAMAKWLQVDAYALLEMTFGGSGYDLACAVADRPIVYQRNGTTPLITPYPNWSPAWLNQSYFVYLNQKQNSREGIRAYRSMKVSASAKEEIRALTMALLSPSLHLRAAAQILRHHEEIVAETLKMEPVQKMLFPDFSGQIKSLGAWGGDFVWALSEESPQKVRQYFNERGYGTVIDFKEMVL